MNRLVSQAFAEVIAEGMSTIPEQILVRLRHVEFLTGTDPVWVGLHPFADVGDGRSYRATAHCAYRHNTTDSSTTIVLPVLVAPHTVVHELGHALDEVLGWTHAAEPVSVYARTNRAEAFAEAFAAWRYWGYGDDDALARDRATVALFERLAA